MRMHTRRAQRGLTLLELLAVLVILVALAGSLIPLISNVLERAHGATGADQITETNKWIQVYKLDHRRLPNDLDALVTGNDVGTPTKYAGLPGGAGGTAFMPLVALDVSDVAALSAAGITEVMDAPDTTPSEAAGGATYGYKGGATSVTLADGMELLTLTGAHAEALGLEDDGSTTGAKYIVLGLGQSASIFGKTAFEPSVMHHDMVMPSGVAMTPITAYSFLGLVFKTKDSSGGALSSAEFKGTYMISMMGLRGAGDHVAKYYKSLPSE